MVASADSIAVDSDDSSRRSSGGGTNPRAHLARAPAAPQDAHSPAATPLFRPEAVRAQTEQFLGSIRLARPLSFAWIAGTAMVLVLAFGTYAAFGEITRTANVPGLLVPEGGMLQVVAPMAGVVAERRVAEGEHVKAGQDLFIIDTDRGGEAGGTAALVARSLEQRQAALEAERASREQQAQIRVGALRDRLRAQELELRRVADEVDLAQRRLELAERAAARARQLAAEGYISEAGALERQDALLDARARLNATARLRGGVERDIQAAKAELGTSQQQANTEAAQMARTKAGLTQEAVENEQRRRVVIRAQRDGIVSALVTSTGASVAAGASLAGLVPATAGVPNEGAVLEAQLFAPNRAAGFIRPGQQVQLRYVAFPYQKFGITRGTVTNVSATPVPQVDLPIGMQGLLAATSRHAEPVFRIVVSLENQYIQIYGRHIALQPGYALDARINIERRTILEWFIGTIFAA